VTGAGLRKAARGSVVAALLATLPIVLIVFAVSLVHSPTYGWDFRAFYNAGRAYLEHRSPYPPNSLAALTSQENFVYPLPVAALFAPLALLPFKLALGLFVTFSAACILLTLRILGVRDSRCYAVALLGLPAQFAVELGTISPLLALGLALLWRFRDRRGVTAVALAALVVAKLFLWPLAIWLIATRRWRTVAAAAGLTVAAMLLSLPLGGLSISAYRDYPSLLHLLSAFESSFSLSLVSLARNLGLSLMESTLLAVALGSALLVAVVVHGRKANDLVAFRLAIAAAFVLSPIVWGHYFVLLLVPLALARPRLSIAWFALASVPATGLLGYQHHLRVVWIAAPLVAGALQLTLGRQEGRDHLGTHARPPLVQGMMVFGLAAAVVASLLSVGSGSAGVAALLPGSGATTAASGTAYVRLERTRQRLCWQIWTEKLAGLSVTGRLVRTRDGATLATKRFDLDADGAASDCLSFPALPFRSLFPKKIGAPPHYRLSLTTDGPQAQTIVGSLRDGSQPLPTR
jgi:alpha-1,2-mannosyltransferase